MKAIKSELEAELPIVPTRIVSDFVQEFMGVKKPDKVKVKNPTGVRPQGLVVPGMVGSETVLLEVFQFKMCFVTVRV
ncbi:hypothetical protein Tco_0956541 [Tanacetum coccineum]